MPTHVVATQSANIRGYKCDVRVEHGYVTLTRDNSTVFHLSIDAAKKLKELINAVLIEYKEGNR